MRYLLALLIPLLTISNSLQAASPVIVSGNPEAPPVVWERAKGLAGVGPELATRILSELDVPFDIKPMGTWQQVQDKARGGNIDLVLSVYKTAERQKFLEYSIPYLNSPVVVVVRKGTGFVCNAWDDMIGKRGVANRGESFGAKFDTFIKNKLQVTFTTYSRAFEMLEEDTADYLLIDLYPALIYSKLLRVEDKVEIMEQPVTVQKFHMAFAKESEFLGLLPGINKRLAELRDQGAIKKLVLEYYQKWTATFQERQRFYDRADQKAKESQKTYAAGAEDRGLEQISRFVEGSRPYMDGSNFNNM